MSANWLSQRTSLDINKNSLLVSPAREFPWRFISSREIVSLQTSQLRESPRQFLANIVGFIGFFVFVVYFREPETDAIYLERYQPAD